VGGDVLFIEATAYPGEGRLTITGQLGDVMKESAQAALSYLKANVWRWGGEVDEGWFRAHDLHVHVPAGAVPKDGPSAGITMATAMASLVTGTPMRSDTAMTGEITLAGHVLPIGGLKEKSLAAQRLGITRIIAPKQNEPDLEDFPPTLLDDVEFIFVESIDRVLEEALEQPKRGGSRNGRRSGTRARGVTPGGGPG
jgi:ATP-dependent Lon protease